MELLRRFVVTFDAPHGLIYLEPTSRLSDPVPLPKLVIVPVAGNLGGGKNQVSKTQPPLTTFEG
jgi:hypothetical protein